MSNDRPTASLASEFLNTQTEQSLNALIAKVGDASEALRRTYAVLTGSEFQGTDLVMPEDKIKAIDEKSPFAAALLRRELNL